MASLADSFLADFDRDEDEDEQTEIRIPTSTSPILSRASSSSSPTEPHVKIEDQTKIDTENNNDNNDHDGIAANDSAMMATTSTPSSLSVLLTSGTLQQHLSTINKLLLLSNDQIDATIEYPIIATSSTLSLNIDTEIALVHKFLRDLYSTHYAELEQLVVSPIEYTRIVQILGNFQHDTDMRLMEKQLQSVIPNNIVLTISVTANTSRGKMLTEQQSIQVNEACNTILSLDEAKKQIYSYIASRMNYIAPNLSSLIGTELAARLITTAGGLKRLSEIPSCNIQVIGEKKQRSAALSSITQDLHVGLISQSSVIQTCPLIYRKKSIRLLAGKVSLAARIDEYREDTTGNKGTNMLNDILAKIDLWSTPPPTSKDKALPVPITTATRKKHRGGARYRKEKDRYAITELQKQKNRMAFGKEELIDEYTGEEYGMIGQATGNSRLRVEMKDTQKLSKKLSKDMQRRLNQSVLGSRTYGGSQQTTTAGGTATVLGKGGGGLSRITGGAVTVIGGANGGTVSTIAFTPTQGIELVNNEQKKVQQQQQQGEEKYFAATLSFAKVGQQHHRDQKKPKPDVPKFH